MWHPPTTASTAYVASDVVHGRRTSIIAYTSAFWRHGTLIHQRAAREEYADAFYAGLFVKRNARDGAVN